jgi:hypothetical protein
VPFTQAEIHFTATIAQGHPDGSVSLDSDGRFKIVAHKVANMPRGGSMPAWKWLYFLIIDGKKTGGYDNKKSFVSWAAKAIKGAK